MDADGMYFQAIKFAPVEYIGTHHRATAQSWILLKRIDVPTQRRWLYSTRRTQADQGIKTAGHPRGFRRATNEIGQTRIVLPTARSASTRLSRRELRQATHGHTCRGIISASRGGHHSTFFSAFPDGSRLPGDRRLLT